MSLKKNTTKTKCLPGEQEFNQAQVLEFIYQDYKQASRYYEKACILGHVMAQYHYGLWFLKDTAATGHVKIDEQRGRKLIQSAAEKDVGIAQVVLAQMYEDGTCGVTKNQTKSMELYKKALQNTTTLTKDQQEQIRIKMTLLHMKINMDKAKDLDHSAFDRTEKVFTSSQTAQLFLLGTNVFAQVQLNRQKKADKKWNVMCDYVDKLPNEEKPNTFHAWEEVMKKCGYIVNNHVNISPKTTDDHPCTFQDFMELSGGCFRDMQNYELQHCPSPTRKCGYCGKEEGKDTKLKMCSRCAQPYCCKTCQMNDWSSHKPVCNAVFNNL